MVKGKFEYLVANELEAAFGELVVCGRRQMAARADCGRMLAGSYGHFDALLSALKPTTQSSGSENAVKSVT